MRQTGQEYGAVKRLHAVLDDPEFSYPDIQPVRDKRIARLNVKLMPATLPRAGRPGRP